MMGFRRRIYRTPPPNPALVATGLVCSWCGQPLGAATATVQTAKGRRHAYVLTEVDEANGRRTPRCQSKPRPESFASVNEYRAYHQREREDRRKRRIDRELRGLDS